MDGEWVFRIFFFVVFITAMATSAFYRRKARQSGETIPRLKEGKAALAARLLLALPLLFFMLCYVFFPALISRSQWPLPAWARWCGVLLSLACPFLAAWVLRHIGKNISETVLTKQEHELVTGGPYRWVRHPLYSTGILLILSLGTVAANGVILGMGLAAAIVFRFVVIPKEERHLIEKFGAQYESYRETTGALLPRL